jgi:hypothetical protein
MSSITRSTSRAARVALAGVATSAMVVGGIAAATPAQAAPFYCGSALNGGMGGGASGGCSGGQGSFRVTARCHAPGTWSGFDTYPSSAWVYRSAPNGWTSTYVGCGWNRYPVGSWVSTKD